MAEEFWNREELYKEIWEQPLVKVAPRYGVSAVALGKTCRKLQIPIPGRGYWAKKEFGKPVKQIPLSEATNLPSIRRLQSNQTGMNSQRDNKGEFNSDDPEVVRIISTEQRDFSSFLGSDHHSLVSRAAKTLARGRVDERGILVPKDGDPILDIRVSRECLERALRIFNAIVFALEEEAFPVIVKTSGQTTSVTIFGEQVPFALIEKLNKSRKEVKHHSWMDIVNEYKPSGKLEFRLGYNGYGWNRSLSDGKIRRLEDFIAECVGKLMRHARHLRIKHEESVRWHAEFEQKQKERTELAHLISEEEQKIRDLDIWVTNWVRAEQIRGFVAALEKIWSEEGHDLSPEGPKGQRITWMRQQAERVDPMLPNPPSILDRKSERRNW